MAALLTAGTLALGAAPAPPALTVEPRPSVSPAVRAAALAALRADARIVAASLWQDSVPRSARLALRGPALAALAAASAARRSARIRLRLLASQLRLVSLRRLSGGRLELVAVWRQLLEPVRSGGGPLGRPLRLDELAELILARRPGSGRFLTWKVVLLS